MTQHPVIGIIGSEGAYGRWLRRFFEERMHLRVLGHDPAVAQSDSAERLLAEADVLLFAVPIRSTEAIIDTLLQQSAGRERGRLWLDITSIKQRPVEAMLRSQAEVVGLHPMTAPPKAPTLKGKVLVICEARLDVWRDWLLVLFAALQAECVRVTPDYHDRAMALIQAMVHATHLAEAGVLRGHAQHLGPPSALLPLRSAAFELDVAVITRILSLNPQIYEDIQFGNPYALEMLDSLLGELSTLRNMIAQGDDAARTAFRTRFLQDNRDHFDPDTLADSNHTFERVGYLLVDLVERVSISVHLPEDRPGTLRALLQVFERYGVSLSSIHSSRTPAGEVHFRIGFEAGLDSEAYAAAVAEIDASQLGKVLKSSAPMR
jgi:prephenate dehydrogenase